MCPSKIALQKIGEPLSQRKDVFKENADFKGMDRQFHAISTSKHFYVWL